MGSREKGIEVRILKLLSYFQKSLFLLTILALLTVSAAAQSTNAITKELDSKLMARKMPYQVFVPKSYDKAATQKYPAVYLLHGLTGKYTNWGLITNLNAMADEYGYVIVTPEGNNGWYSDSPVKEDDQYESYIVKELIPEIEKDYNVDSKRSARSIAGLSMGGYGALKFGLKYPELFVLAGSFSGAVRAAELSDKTFPAWKVLGTSVNSAFGPMDSKSRTENNLFTLLDGKSKDDLKTLPFLYIDCGTEDGLIVQNRDFVDSLMKKKVPHEFRQLPGGHNAKYWRSQIGEFFEVTSRFIEKTETEKK